MDWSETFDVYVSEKSVFWSPSYAKMVNSLAAFWKQNEVRSSSEIIKLLNSLPIQNQTKNKYLNFLRSVKRWTEIYNIDSPLRHLVIPRNFPVDIQMPRIPRFEEVEHLIEVTDDPKLKVLLILLKNTGARIREALNLKWSDVDFNNRLIVFRTRKTGGRGSKEIIVPMNDEVYNALKSLQPVGEYVFASRRSSSKHMSYPWYRLEKLRQVTKLNIRGFHAIRHFFATHLLRSGVPLHVVKELCGHSTIRTTEKYLHVFDEDLRKAVRILEGKNGGY